MGEIGYAWQVQGADVPTAGKVGLLSLSRSGKEMKKSFSPVARGAVLLMLRTQGFPRLQRAAAAADKLASIVLFPKLTPAITAGTAAQCARAATLGNACCDREPASKVLAGGPALLLLAAIADEADAGPARRRLANMRDMLPAPHQRLQPTAEAMLCEARDRLAKRYYCNCFVRGFSSCGSV